MISLAILVTLLVVVVTFTYGVARSLLQVWLEHRLKLALLEKYEAHPEIFESSEEALAVLAAQRRGDKKPARQDYTVTGVILSVLGLGGVVAGRIIGVGQFAVGVYLGGLFCAALGVLIALLGLLIRALGKNALAEAREN